MIGRASTRIGAIAAATCVAATASAQSGAIFHMSGPATEGRSGMWGDAILESVEFPGGETFSDFVTARAVTDFQCASSYRGLGWSVSTGTECTTGDPGWFKVQAEDGDSSDITDEDRELFNQRVTEVLNDRNLNSLVHLKSANASFIIEFNETIHDDDPEFDNFGEILYFERGTNAGNSTAYIQAVDEDGNALGPLVMIDGDETLPTTPIVTIGTPWATHLTNQTMGGATVDLTRLGVESIRYLRVTNGTSDPDFKIFAVWTRPRVLPQRPNPFD
ncbi:MAG: hypothetical protein AAFX79_02950 [Planctomycetota bacterium]